MSELTAQAVLLLGLAATIGAGCSRPPSPDPARAGNTSSAPTPPMVPPPPTPDVAVDAAVDAGSASDAGEVADAEASGSDDPAAGHLDTKEGLLALFAVRPMEDAERARLRPEAFLAANVGYTPSRMNQGNKAVARHAVSRRACLAGLRGVVLQTDEQRRLCKGMDNMVPVYAAGDLASARVCVDIFEFPNRACELPVVWAAPSAASAACTIQGKRLCKQEEWNLACRADPTGGPDSTFAYGNEMDLTVCNTNKARPDPADAAQIKAARDAGRPVCNGLEVKSAWATCGTDTEPAGSFPRCRSRLGVYDQHGNVAEIMTRTTPEKKLVSQLKGSAFFYVDVARKPGEPQKPGGRQTYPDHCNFDPRWHVEPMEAAFHVNYHLGFRCCLPL